MLQEKEEMGVGITLRKNHVTVDMRSQGGLLLEDLMKIE